MDPPTQALSNANITLAMLSIGASKGKPSFGFLLGVAARPGKQLKDRQKDAARDLLQQVEQLTAGKNEGDLRAWCQVPTVDASLAEPAAVSKTLEKLKETVKRRLSSTGKAGAKPPIIDLDFAEPISFVLTKSAAFNGNDETTAQADLTALDFFEPEAGAALLEAQRINGLLRQKWYLATVKATRKGGDEKEGEKKKGDGKGEPLFRVLPLGVGLATDVAVAKARALRSAEIRAEVVSEAMFLRPTKAETK